MRERVVGAMLALVAVITALGIAELGLRIAAPVADPYVEIKIRRTVNQYIRSEFPPNLRMTTEAEPGLPGVTGTNTFSTNNMGFRGDSLAQPKPPDEYRIFVLGGSSAECLYLDDGAALTTVVQQELQRSAAPGTTVRVYGAAKSGDRSDDHISMLVHRLVHLRPDLVVVFAGINDLTGSIYGLDPLHRVVYSPLGTTAPDTLGFVPLLRLAATEFQIPRRLHYLMKRIRPGADAEVLQAIHLRSDYRSLVAKRKAGVVTDDPPPVDTETFRQNLRTLIAAAGASGARVVLMTQQTTWASTVDPRVEEWQWLLYRNERTYRPEHMRAAMDSLNSVTRALAAAHTLPLYDLARAVPPSQEYFYDDVHFTTFGARRAGEELAAVIRTSDGFPHRTPR